MFSLLITRRFWFWLVRCALWAVWAPGFVPLFGAPLALPKITLLTPPGFLPSQLYAQMEKACLCKVRVILSGGLGDVEAKLRWGGRSADVAWVSEREAESLAQARFIKAFSSPPPGLAWQPKGLLQKDKVMPDGVFFVPLMADVMGVLTQPVFATGTDRGTTQGKKNLVENHDLYRLENWSQLTYFDQFPQFRGRLWVPEDSRFQDLLARMAFPKPHDGSQPPALDVKQLLWAKEKREAWLRILRRQTVGHTDPWLPHFLAAELGGVITWLSTARMVQRMSPGAPFIVPKADASCFERYGLVLIAESGLEEPVTKLVHFLWEKKEELSQHAKLIDLKSTDFLGSNIDNWVHLSERLLSELGK